MQKPESSFVGIGQTTPIAANEFRQVEGADDVGLHKVAGALDRTVYMALGRKVDDCTRLVLD